MVRMNVRKLLSLAVAGLGLLGAARAICPRISSAAAVDDANAPVIRFVKNPEMAPPLQAQDLSGKPVNKDNWAGKVVLVNFWATWCPPCRVEIPELLELKKEYKNQLEIVGISEDDDPPESVLKFARQKGMTYPIVMATPELVEAYGGVPALPTSFLIDTQGRVVQKHSGLYPIETYDLEIRALLGMPTNARVETFVDTGQVFLRNAANATELPGVNFKGLTADQKKRALRRLNSDSCTCGCKLTLSQCRVNDSECPVSGKLAAQIVKEAAGGAKPARTAPPKGTSSITQ
ncbi:MAG TPA: TlpA disulfide reductase family protein [Candidatus Acidoferrum sp.]|nr:TlpA disulfide reductase family protein [Candidatus Acidoferrum sp.]